MLTSITIFFKTLLLHNDRQSVFQVSNKWYCYLQQGGCRWYLDSPAASDSFISICEERQARSTKVTQPELSSIDHNFYGHSLSLRLFLLRWRWKGVRPADGKLPSSAPTSSTTAVSEGDQGTVEIRNQSNFLVCCPQMTREVRRDSGKFPIIQLIQESFKTKRLKHFKITIEY